MWHVRQCNLIHKPAVSRSIDFLVTADIFRRTTVLEMQWLCVISYYLRWNSELFKWRRSVGVRGSWTFQSCVRSIRELCHVRPSLFRKIKTHFMLGRTEREKFENFLEYHVPAAVPCLREGAELRPPEGVVIGCFTALGDSGILSTPLTSGRGTEMSAQWTIHIQGSARERGMQSVNVSHKTETKIVCGSDLTSRHSCRKWQENTGRDCCQF